VRCASLGKNSTMRVIECNECGETISAANDKELGAHLVEHLQSEHDIDVDDADLAEMLDGAYDAMDS
jgi:predicted small metal-binding protein